MSQEGKIFEEQMGKKKQKKNKTESLREESPLGGMIKHEHLSAGGEDVAAGGLTSPKEGLAQDPHSPGRRRRASPGARGREQGLGPLSRKLVETLIKEHGVGEGARV